MKTQIIVSVCASTGIALGLLAGWLHGPDQYLSKAVILATPPIVSLNHPRDMTRSVNLAAQELMSRSRLAALIQFHGLYVEERRRLPLEDIIETVKREAFHLAVVRTEGDRPNSAPALELSFRYRDRFVAQRVTAALVGECLRQLKQVQSVVEHQVALAMKEQVEQAGKEYESKLALQNVSVERKDLDVALARQHYETMARRRQMAESDELASTQQLGGYFVLLDPASLPTEPESRRLWFPVGGLAIGLTAGFLVAWFWRWRQSRRSVA